MRAFVLLALSCLASASALVLSAPAAALRTTAAPARAPARPVMNNNQVVRVEVEIENGEPLEKALRRFRKATNMSGHLRLLRNRKTFESTHDKKIRKEKESLQRLARARRSARARM
uniref:30S ribosomal protein S21 n=1 Tax=Calcidiscus leptoporus TaxID=127549 RepID=A0A7S0NUK9_9EUKA|mmetsp:Transcript_27929/g.65182  ORF Transcript_27929/g.65182 Transcript_27929/m.65182 type:complete len:116 (+) Transcript_27929:38-385(+)